MIAAVVGWGLMATLQFDKSRLWACSFPDENLNFHRKASKECKIGGYYPCGDD
jgi:hypothetical protein